MAALNLIDQINSPGFYEVDDIVKPNKETDIRKPAITEKKDPNNFYCPECPFYYYHKRNLDRHRRSAHNFVSENVPYNINCHLCTENFQSVKKLILHYNDVHGKNIEIKTNVFTDMEGFSAEEQFEIWKHNTRV